MSQLDWQQLFAVSLQAKQLILTAVCLFLLFLLLVVYSGKKKLILEAEENPFQKSWNKKLGPYILGETRFCGQIRALETTTAVGGEGC